jgi:hypothetical protein
MTTNVVSVNGDYKIKTVQGGNITLDTGTTGSISVIGDLTVSGTTTSVTTTNTDIRDNVLVLNKGQTGTAGVTNIAPYARQSGIEIDRGQASDNRGNALFLWDEQITWVTSLNEGRSGAFVFKTNGANGGLNAIKISGIVTDGADLTLISYGNGVISVVGTSDYETNVTDDDHIPNKKYVDDAISDIVLTGGSGNVISDRNSSIRVVDNTNLGLGTSKASVIIDGDEMASFFGSYASIFNVKISKDTSYSTIEGTITNGNLKLSANGTGVVQISSNDLLIDKTLTLAYQASTPSTPSGSTKVYSKSGGTATNLYYVNSSGSGELISKSKALAYSIVFG